MSRPTTDWEARSLASLATYLNGFAFKPQHWGEEGLPIVRIRELLDPAVEPDRYDGPLAHDFKIHDGDLIFSWSATLAALFWDRGPAYLNQHLFKVTPACDVDIRFLNHLINFHLDRLSARSHGTTMKHVTRGDLDGYMVELPPASEQAAVAEILEALDDQIRSMIKVVEKCRLRKIGLVDELVDAARRADLPVRSLGEIASGRGGFIQTGPFGSQLHSSDYVNAGVPVVMPQDLSDGRVNLDSIAQVSETMARSLSRHRMLPGDVVFARRGDLGRCAEINKREQGWLCGTGCLLVRTPPAVLTAGWLALVYRHELGQSHVRANAVGSTMANLNSGILASLRLPVPPVANQRNAVAVIEAHDRELSLEHQRLAKLYALKSALATDLLSGRVRVPKGVAL
ncbi:MAG: restriction endonuclease subunit S [Mycolicibacterium cosmeticum]|nr:restriction endonuclease subunit S [Mycolicibacterium cosmeticum]